MTSRALLAILVLGAALAACADPANADKSGPAAAKLGGGEGSTLNAAQQRGLPFPASGRRATQ